ncbi:MAG TPA: AarF/UbiB family protein [Polyangium sp.]|nr:AarF/UbiB family protein [Polyangium sp.]
MKQKYIPTPLVHSSESVDRDIPEPVNRYRFFFILSLIFRVTWYIRKIRAGAGGKYTMQSLARMVTADFERLGGIWIKAAQILGMRRDIFPREFCDEISRLHDRAHGFPGAIARQIIEEELGQPIDAVFKDFQDKPLAAASIGQVHVAWLQETGKKVAIKVQRPAVAESFRHDLGILSKYFSFLAAFNVMSWARWDEMYQTLEQTLVDELDYRLEVATMRRMRRTLKADKIVAPKVHTKYCTKRVLTMEFIDGVLMSDYIRVLVNDRKRAKRWCKENGINTKKFGRKLFISMLNQLLDDNLLHGDLHPGNIMMLKKNRIAYIDFGSVSILDMTYLAKYVMSMRALATKDFSAYADIYFTMIPDMPTHVDLNHVKKEIVAMAEEWQAKTTARGIPYEQRSLTAFVTGLSNVVGKYQFSPMWNALRLMRSTAALDASLRFVLPNLNFYDLMRRYYNARRARRPKTLSPEIQRMKLARGLTELLKLPYQASQNLFFQADMIKKRALAFEAGFSKASAAGQVMIRLFFNLGILATVIMVVRYISKTYYLGQNAISSTPVRDIFASLPSLAPGVWIVIIVASLYLLRSLSRLAQLLGIKSPGTNPYLKGGS